MGKSAKHSEEKEIKNIYNTLEEEDIKFLVQHGLSKLLTWFIAFLTVFISFLQLLTVLQPYPEEDISIIGLLWYIFKKPLWIIEYLLLIAILFVVRKIFITYENQMEWESRLPRDLWKIIWRRADKASQFLISHSPQKDGEGFVRAKRVKIALIILFMLLNWVLLSRFFEGHI